MDKNECNRPALVYLHGLNSSGGSHKAGVLRERLPTLTVVAPTYPAHRPDEAVAQLSDYLAQFAEPPYVIGSSMGGFYGQYLARRLALGHLFMINPALNPWELLADRADTVMTTASGESYRLTRETIERTRVYGIECPCPTTVDTTLFLDRGDETIDYRIAEALYRDCGRVLVFPGGDHAFRHLDEAIETINETVVDTPGRDKR